MENYVIKEVLSELLEESKNNRKEIIFLTNAIETNAKNLADIYSYLNNLKINIPFNIFKSDLKNGIDEIKSIIELQPKEILNEKKILLFPDTLSDENIFRFLYRKTLLFCLVGLGLFLVVKYTSHVLIENSKYKQVYEYIYYNNENSQDQLQSVIKAFENDSTSQIMEMKIQALKKKINN